MDIDGTDTPIRLEDIELDTIPTLIKPIVSSLMTEIDKLKQELKKTQNDHLHTLLQYNALESDNRKLKTKLAESSSNSVPAHLQAPPTAGPSAKSRAPSPAPKKNTSKKRDNQKLLETEETFQVIDSKRSKKAKKTLPVLATSTESTTPRPTPPPTTARSDAAKVPPIVVHERAIWGKLSEMLKSKNINFTKASLTKQGIRIFPTSSDDYRSITKILETLGHQYHSFCPEEQKTLTVAIRGIPTDITPEQVLEDLTLQGFHPLNVTRMQSKERIDIPIVKVRVPKSDSPKIFETKSVNYILVKVEPIHPKPEIPQCYNCQRYGHTKNFCHSETRCRKCAENHASNSCQKPQDTEFKCANCGEAHVTTYKGCKAIPKIPQKKPHRQNRYDTTPGTSFADKLKGTKNSKPQKTQTSPPQTKTPEQTSMEQFLTKLLATQMEIMQKSITSFFQHKTGQ